jgi:hypothetical protein
MVTGFFATVLVPETKGKTLEELSGTIDKDDRRKTLASEEDLLFNNASDYDLMN